MTNIVQEALHLRSLCLTESKSADPPEFFLECVAISGEQRRIRKRGLQR